MNNKVKASVVATVLLMLPFIDDSGIRAQEPTSSPSQSVNKPPVDKAKSEVPNDDAAKTGSAKAEAEKAAQTPEATAKPAQAPAAAAPAPVPDFWHQEEMTGDWGGYRSKWKEKGFQMEFSLTQYYQGVASGGLETRDAYNGNLATAFKFDFGKLVGLKWWLGEIRTETRFGSPLLTTTGSLNPINTRSIIPGSSGTLFSVTSVNVTRIFPLDLAKGNMIALSFGRYNLLDTLDEDFFAGGGTERFMNIASIAALTVLREVPIITNAVNFAYIRKGEPFFTFSVMDPNDYSLEPGLAEIFEDGVTFAPGIHFPTRYWGKSGKHSFSGAITTKEYTPFDAIRSIIIPGPPLVPIEPESGSWSASYAFRQYFVERGRRDGWGLFTQLSFANKSTSPITAAFNIGLGGNGLFESRKGDEFGVSYAYTDLSEVLKDNIDLISIGGRRPRAEHQFEFFYNLHITPWLRLTGDLQVIRPNRPIADTAIVPGVRLKMIF